MPIFEEEGSVDSESQDLEETTETTDESQENINNSSSDEVTGVEDLRLPIFLSIILVLALSVPLSLPER